MKINFTCLKKTTIQIGTILISLLEARLLENQIQWFYSKREFSLVVK